MSKSSVRRLRSKYKSMKREVTIDEPQSNQSDRDKFENSVIEDVRTGALSFPPGFNPNAKAIATKTTAAGVEVEIRLGALQWVSESENMQKFLALNPKTETDKFYSSLSMKLTDRLTVHAIAFFFPPYADPKISLVWLRSSFSQEELDKLPGEVKAIAPEIARALHALVKVRFAAATDEKVVEEIEKSNAKD